jgi:Zn-dependent peptidase ImmA (M78 family)
MAEPAGVIYRAGRQRRVVSVLAHELTHLLINAEYGAPKFLTLRHGTTWKIEGYADYIARESSFPEQEGMALFCAGKADPSPSYAYFRYRLVVRYLLDDAGLTFRGLVSQPMDFADMAQRARQAMCH